ncbi:hypothetical protein WOC18_24735, partial [Vibrio parahaemolyticus]
DGHEPSSFYLLRFTNTDKYNRTAKDTVTEDILERISGISLLKKSLEENKICTFYIMPKFKGRELGSKLLEKSLNYFDDNEVLISVSNERLSELYPTLSSKGFVLDSCVEHMYRNENIEHFFKAK